MLRRGSLGLILASILVSAACGSARVIQRTLTGGVIELTGDQGKAMEEANSQMAAQCGANNFTIVKDGDEPVGTSTHAATKWRVHYQCNGAVGSPPDEKRRDRVDHDDRAPSPNAPGVD